MKIVGIVLLATIVLQMLYPRTVMPPNSSIAGSYLGLKSRTSALNTIAQQGKDGSITVKVGAQSFSTTLQEMGVTVDAEKTLKQAVRYPWYLRLVPFTIFKRHSLPSVALQSKDASKTNSFVTGLTKYDVAPVNAGVTLADTNISVTEAKNGISYSSNNQGAVIANAQLFPDKRIVLKGEVVKPKVTNDAANKTAEVIKKQLATQFTVSVENQVQTVEPKILATWITTAPDEKTGSLNVVYNKEKIRDYLQPFAEKIYVAGVAKKVSTVDGEVVSEIGGSPGKAMKLDASIDEVVKALTASQGAAKTIVQAVTPVSVVSATYTRTSKGLQALLNDWAKNHKGKFYVSLKTTAGDINAAYNATTKVYPASIYKMFVADVAYNKALQGQLDLNAVTPTGKTIAECIDLMIVRSDNPCAYAVGDAIGWEANNGFLASQGFGSTTLKKQAWNTNANDIANLMIKLNSGSLIGDYTSTLLSMMQRQVYRTGIPAGSAGAVADKVGFIDEFNHDAGIVYHPNGSYALVIMTSGSNFSQIAELSRQISNVMKQ